MSELELFLKEIENKEIELHSCIVKYKDHYLIKKAALPYQLDQPQMLFSISKSFVSLAIGYLYEEKRLCLDDLVLMYFPEYVLKANPAFRTLKIVHLLTMTSGSMNESPLFMQNNWISAFFTQKPEALPGQYFYYNSMNTYILSVIVSRITQQSCNAYLYEKLFKPLGICKPHFDHCSLGYNTGGWGLYLSPLDLSKVGDAILERKRVLPIKFLDQMMSKKVTCSHHCNDSYHQHYGYLCWIDTTRHWVRFDGVFGQMMIFDLKHPFYMIITANVIDTDRLYECVYRYLDHIEDNACHLPLKPLNTKQSFNTLPFLTISKQLFELKNTHSSLLSLPIRFLEKRYGYSQSFTFVYENQQLSLYWQEAHVTNILKIGLDGQFINSIILLYGKCFKIACLGYFDNKQRFTLYCVFLEYPYTRMIHFDFLTSKKIWLQFEEIPSIDMILEHYRHMLKFTPFHTINAWIVEKGYHLICPSAIALKKNKKAD